MSAYSGPKVSTTGTVFYYDMSNQTKSWKGKPTTNLISSQGLGYGYYAYVSGNPTDIITFDQIGNSQLCKRYTISSAVNAARGAFYPTTMSASTDYAFSFYLKYNGNNVTVPSIYADASKGYPEGGANNNSFNSSSLTATLIGNNWYYCVYKFNYSSCPTSKCILAFGINTGSDSTYLNNTFDVYNAQLEVGTFATPYIEGTRTDTQAIVDLTRNNTLTSTNLTYNSDNTFQWDSGVDARIQAPSSSNFAFGTGDFSIECWVNPTNFGNYTHMVALPDQNTFVLKANISDGAIYFYSSAFTTYPTTGWTLVAGAWNHIVLTRVSSVAYCYLNGAFVGSKSGFTNNFTSQVLNIGNGYGSEWTAKKIGIVKIYNRALTAIEIKQNFQAIRGRYGL